METTTTRINLADLRVGDEVYSFATGDWAEVAAVHVEGASIHINWSGGGYSHFPLSHGGSARRRVDA